VKVVAPAVSAENDIPDAARVALATAALVIMWNFRWFVDLTDRNLLAASTDGTPFTQVIFLTLGAGMGAAILWLGAGRLKPLANRPTLLFIAWSIMTTLTSVDIALSIRRLGFFFIAGLIVAGLVILPRSGRQFGLALLLSAGIVLVASYLGIVFVPQLAVHNAFDIGADPDHAGLWRGIFDGKNTAGTAMLVIIFAGLYIAATLERVSGWVVVVAAIVFLLGSHSKTALATLPMVLVSTTLFRRVESRGFRLTILIAPTALLLTVSIGSILIPPIKSLLSSVMSDPSFTGRAQIWEFALTNILARPIQGWGYGAFWGTSQTLYGSDTTDWAPAAAHAHNSYLDAAINGGIPGLVLLVLVYVVVPLRDMLTLAERSDGLDDMTMLFIRIWYFGLLSACFEASFQNTRTAMCYMMLLSIFGLRMRASYRPRT
jgi:O-antigen ligase